MNRIRLVTFDAFGTLFAPKPAVHVQYLQIARKFNIQVPEDTMEANCKASIKKLNSAFPNYGKAQGLTVDEWWHRAVTNAFPDHDISDAMATELIEQFGSGRAYSLLPGARDLLTYLQNDHPNVSLAVLSNGDPHFKNVLKELDIANYFDSVFLSYTTELIKPSPAAFNGAKNAYGLKALECCHVGDSLEEDFKGALLAGWNSVLVDPKVKGLQVSALGDTVQLMTASLEELVGQLLVKN